MQVSVSESTGNVISRLIANGQFSSPGDVIDVAVAMLDLKGALDAGLQDIVAGRVAPLDMELIKEQVRTKASSART